MFSPRHGSLSPWVTVAVKHNWFSLKLGDLGTYRNYELNDVLAGDHHCICSLSLLPSIYRTVTTVSEIPLRLFLIPLTLPHPFRVACSPVVPGGMDLPE